MLTSINHRKIVLHNSSLLILNKRRAVLKFYICQYYKSVFNVYFIKVALSLCVNFMMNKIIYSNFLIVTA